MCRFLPFVFSSVNSSCLAGCYRFYTLGINDRIVWTLLASRICSRLFYKMLLSAPQNIGEHNEKDFISLFDAILRMRNILTSFDEFQGCDVLARAGFAGLSGMVSGFERRVGRAEEEGASSDIDDDIVFEIELVRQVEINIDYILLLVKKYHDSHSDDKEILITIRKSVDASPELRSKKSLIENFISGINDVKNAFLEWRDFVMWQKEQELTAIITAERLKPEETWQYIETALQAGEIKTTGTDIDRLMPPVSRFGGGNHAAKKQDIIDKLKTFFNKFFGIV